MLCIMNSIQRLIDIIGRHSGSDGIHDTPLPGVSLLRSSTPTMPMSVVYEPTLCLVVQGRKQAVLGTTSYVYDVANYLVASVELPVMGSVIEASAECPYLCLRINLNMATLSDLALRHPLPNPNPSLHTSGLFLSSTTPELLDAASRLVALLDNPSDAEALAPIYLHEILYRLLTGSGSWVMRQMAYSNSRLNAIARSIVWLRENYGRECRIDDIATVAGMSRSTFHSHFKAVTCFSPLEFRARLRLQEGRRLMVAEGLDAATAGYRVGYESPSQFSREYGKLFGASPGRDAQRLRNEVLAPAH